MIHGARARFAVSESSRLSPLASVKSQRRGRATAGAAVKCETGCACGAGKVARTCGHRSVTTIPITNNHCPQGRMPCHKHE